MDYLLVFILGLVLRIVGGIILIVVLIADVIKKRAVPEYEEKIRFKQDYFSPN